MDEAALRARLEADPQDWVAAEQLSRLYAGAGRWPDLIELLLQRLEQPDADRVDLYLQLGDAFEEGLGDPERALVVLLEAFSDTFDDARLGARLGRLAARAAAWETLLQAYERLLTDATARQAQPMHRRLAEWYEALEREEDVARHLRRLLVLKPDDDDALEALTGFYEQAEDWEGLTQLLRTRVNYLEDPDARRRLYLRVGRLLETRLEAPGEALEWLGRLFAEAPDDGIESTLERLAEISGEWHTLARIYTESLETNRLEGASAAAVQLRLARIYRDRVADEQRAVRRYKAVLQLSPGDRQATVELRAIYEKNEQWAELAHRLGVDAQHSDDRSEKYKLYFEQGRIYQEHLDAPKEAVDALFRALENRPDDKLVLVRLMDAYRGTGQWEASLKVLKKLASLEVEPAKKAGFVYAMGIIQRDKLEDSYIAVRTLDRALELDPTMIKAFQAIDEVLTRDGDYARQDRYYRKMLARAREHRLDEALVVNLARNLGEINRSRLGNYEEALKAYSIVVRRRPEDRAARTLVAELSILLERYEDAARHLFHLVQQDVVDTTHYHDLVRVYAALDRLDAAWCVCQALVAMGRSQPDEDQLYDMGLGRQAQLQVGTMEELDWKLITWANKNRALDALLRRLTHLLGPHISQTPKSLGLKRPLEPTHPLIQILAHHVAPVMGMPVPTAFEHSQTMGLSTAPTWPPALLVGPDIMRRPPVEVAYLAARQLFLQTDTHFLVTRDDTAAHREARLVGLVATTARWLGHTVPDEAVDTSVLQILEQLPPSERDAFAPLMAPLISLPRFGVPTWLDAVEHTANRIGLLTSNDLTVALRQLKRILNPIGPSSPGERTRLLLLFALSEPYFELRRRLGYAIA